MKKILYICLSLALFFQACNLDKTDDPFDASAKVSVYSGEYSVGLPMFFKVVADAETFTLFPGDSGRKFNDPEAIAPPIGIAKSAMTITDTLIISEPVTYTKTGIYEVVLYAVSYGENGEETKEATDKITIVITEKRNTLNSAKAFLLPPDSIWVNAKFGAADTIHFEFKEGKNITNLETLIVPTSPVALVTYKYVDEDVEYTYTYGMKLDFTRLEAFRVTPEDPAVPSRYYPVDVYIKPLSNSAQLLRMIIKTSVSKDVEIIGTIDEENKTVDFIVPGDIKSTTKFSVLANSTGTEQYYNNRFLAKNEFRDNLKQDTAIKIVAESGFVQYYKCIYTEYTQFYVYKFASLTPEVIGTVTHPVPPDNVGKIDVRVLATTNLTALVATFEGNTGMETYFESIDAETKDTTYIPQVSGVSVLDFTKPVRYKVVSPVLGTFYYNVVVTKLSK